MRTGRAYRRLSFRCDPASEELLVAELWALGTLGVESETAAGGSVVARAWFPAGAGGEAATVAAAATGVELLADEEIADRDWLAEYRRRARPAPLGGRFWADPREPPAAPAPAGRVRLSLPARQAFGTGSHPSTRLAVELLEERPPAGRSLLDVGAGTGVLSLVALHLGARPVVAVEIDPVAALQAGEIAVRNAARLRLLCGTTRALAGVVFDRIAVNMTLGSLASVLPDLPRLLAERGELVVSGCLAEQGADLAERLGEAGLTPVARRAAEEWIAVCAVRTAP